MTSRERWTVYPLLFLAIGLALRAANMTTDGDGQLRSATIDTGSVVCRELRIETDDGTTLVHIGRVKGGGGGRIEIRDADGRDSVAVGTRPGRREGGVEFFERDGRESARLTTTGLGDPPPDEPGADDQPSTPIEETSPEEEENSPGVGVASGRGERHVDDAEASTGGSG